MAQAARETFPHRLNPDGSVDSICPKCLKTVATKRSEVELTACEASHTCGGLNLGYTLRPEDQRRRPRL
jgi:hypothetical protein